MIMHRSRIETLEKRNPQGTELPLIFIKICEGGHGRPILERIGMAHVLGVGRIKPEEGETEAAFVRRAYAMYLARCPLEELTEVELEAAQASAYEFNAAEQARQSSGSVQSAAQILGGLG